MVNVVPMFFSLAMVIRASSAKNRFRRMEYNEALFEMWSYRRVQESSGAVR